MRQPILLCSLLLAALARADRLIDIPTAHKVPYGSVRIEYDTETSGQFQEEYADFGIGKSFEAAVRLQHPVGLAEVGTFDLAYNYLAPIPGLAPGVSVGVQDALDQTPDGRRFYAALTSRQVYSTPSGDSNGDVTLGVFVGAHTSAFVGMDLPLSTKLRLLVEDDGYRPSGGIEYRPAADLGIRFITRGNLPLVSVSTTTRF